jgi:integrase
VDEQRAFLRAVQASLSARNRAIATVFFYTAVRLSELADLEVADRRFGVGPAGTAQGPLRQG